MDNMKRAKKARILFLISGALFAAMGIAAFILVNHFMDLKDYLWLAVSFVISAIGFYGAVFLLFASFDRAVIMRLIPIAEEFGIDNVSTVAEVLGWREDAVAKYIAKCKKWRYL